MAIRIGKKAEERIKALEEENKRLAAENARLARAQAEEEEEESPSAQEEEEAPAIEDEEEIPAIEEEDEEDSMADGDEKPSASAGRAATLAELKAEFGDDSRFIAQMYRRGATLAEAKEAALLEQESLAGAPKAGRGARAGTRGDTGGASGEGVSGADGGPRFATYEAAHAHCVKNGMKPGEAHAHCARNYEKLHTDWKQRMTARERKRRQARGLKTGYRPLKNQFAMPQV